MFLCLLHFRNTEQTSIRPTEMFLSHAYDLYYNKLFRGLTQAFIPFLLMALLNGRIIFKMTEYKRITSTRVTLRNINLVTFSEDIQLNLASRFFINPQLMLP